MAREEFLKPYRLAEILRVEFSDLEPHQSTPTERQLAERFGVSRVSIRQALALLADEGVIYTVRGAGSFASPARSARRMQLRSFLEELKDRGVRPSTRVLDVTLVVPRSPRKDEWAEVSEPTYRIERLRLGDDLPVAHDVSYIPHRIAPGLDQRQLTGSIYDILRSDFKQEVVSADDRLQARVIDAPATALELSIGDPVIEINRRSYNARSELIEQLRTVRRADRWDFQYTLRA